MKGQDCYLVCLEWNISKVTADTRSLPKGHQLEMAYGESMNDQWRHMIVKCQDYDPSMFEAHFLDSW